jgi:hypothetical protein
MKKLMIAALAAAACFTACSDDKSSSTAPFQQLTPSNGGEQNNGLGIEPGCNFDINANEWKFITDEGWKMYEVYTWTDNTTVKHATWMGSYNNPDKDEILTGTREEIYQEAKSYCELMNSED